MMDGVASPASATEALEMVHAGLGYLASADPTALATETQARCLMGLERAQAMGTAARASILAAFTAARGYCEDADYSPRSWLIHQTKITRGAAVGYLSWGRRAAAHPAIRKALAAGEMSESYARTICTWTDRLPEDSRDTAGEILVAAALGGADLRDLAGFAAEMYARSQPEPDQDPGQAFEDRSVRLETTFDGAGVLRGDLTPECAAVVTTVLDALSAPAGAEDTRSHEQRYHDALEEAMRRLVAADLVPERAGQPAKVWAHIALADLLAMDTDSALQDEWIARTRAQWAAARAGASIGGSDGAAWLEGDAAQGLACDASVTPVVTGEVNFVVLEDLVRLCAQLDRLRHGARRQDDHDRDGEIGPDPARPGTSPAWEALEQAIIGKAVDLLSGPGGLASFLRRRQLGVKLGGPSLPLDIGYSENVPAGIRNAVILRDKHCRWPGCNQPAAACQVHHVKHKANGGHTSVRECVLLCHYHHQVVIHRWGWALVLNPDGTTTAWNPDRTKILHSHGPPIRPG